jgi:serine/threonine protein phosphatase PrpC
MENMHSPEFTISAYAATDVGKIRLVNEDACLMRSDIGLFVVADGMGGHSSGDFASNLIVQRLGNLDAPGDMLSFIAAVRESLHVSNALILEAARDRGPDTIIGSTVVALLISGAEYAVLWAGDSRLYRLRGGLLQQLTRDHTALEDIVAAGASINDSPLAPYANSLTRAIGAFDSLELETVRDVLRPGDALLLCSDGLTRMVPDAEILRILSESEPLQAIGALIAAALQHGGRDNVTAVAAFAQPSG